MAEAEAETVAEAVAAAVVVAEVAEVRTGLRVAHRRAIVAVVLVDRVHRLPLPLSMAVT